MAICRNPLHSRCAKEKKVSRRVGDGRTLGLLATWLAQSTDHLDREQHALLAADTSYEDRRTARDALGTAENANLFQTGFPDGGGILPEPFICRWRRSSGICEHTVMSIINTPASNGQQTMSSIPRGFGTGLKDTVIS